MNLYRSKLATALVLTLTLVTSAFAQQPQPAAKPTQPAHTTITIPAPHVPATAVLTQQPQPATMAVPPVRVQATTPAPSAHAPDTAIFAQQPQPATTQPQATTTTPAPTPRGPDYVDFTGFKGKVYDVKHRSPRALADALRYLGSGFKGAVIQFSDEFKTITVRDFPENIATIEEALKRLDTPQPIQPDIELRMHVILASNVEGVTSQFPTELNDVVKQLQATLSYKSYTTVATVTQRATEGGRSISLRGMTEIPGKFIGREQPEMANYDFTIPNLTVTNEASGYTVELRDTYFNFSGSSSAVGRAEIRTSLSVRSGEKVVVGTVTLGNKGLILVLSAKASK